MAAPEPGVLPAAPPAAAALEPTTGALWIQAAGDRGRFRELLLEHGYAGGGASDGV